MISSITAKQSVNFCQNDSCWDCQQYCCRFTCQINSNNSLPAALLTNHLLRVTTVVTMRNLFATLSDDHATLGVTRKSIHLHFSTFISIIIYPIDNTADEWLAKFFQCLGDLNLNQRSLEQDPGLRGPVGGLRRVFIELEIIIFWFAEWIQKHSGMTPGNIFEDYMKDRDQIQRTFQIMTIFMRARASKPLYHRMRINAYGYHTIVSDTYLVVYLNRLISSVLDLAYTAHCWP